MGKNNRNSKKSKKLEVTEAESTIPQSLVVHTGEVNANVRQLEKNIRNVMEPHTATRLKVRRRNVLKDFVQMAGPLNVSNFMVFSETKDNVNLRVARAPRGPTVTFKVKEYSLNKEVQAISRKPFVPNKEHLFPALLIMNNFDKERFEHKLLSTMFQNMFPAIDVKNIRLGDLKRCVLLDYDKENDLVHWRHFQICVKPAGLSRGVKKVVVQAKIPNLNRVNDISDFVQGAGCFSDSEPEDDDDNVSLPQTMKSAGNKQNETSAIKLKEIGPRMSLFLLKIEQGLSDGDVLYHGIHQKSEEEVAKIKAQKERERSQKALRKYQQEKNIEKKQQAKLDHKAKCEAGAVKRTHDDVDDDDDNNDNDNNDNDENDDNDNDEFDNDESYVYDNGTGEVSDDDDNEYYKEAVGIAPDIPLKAPTSNFVPGFAKKDFNKLKQKGNDDNKKLSGKKDSKKGRNQEKGSKKGGKITHNQSDLKEKKSSRKSGAKKRAKRS